MYPYEGKFVISKLYGTPAPAGMTYSAGKHPGADFVGRTNKNIHAVKSGYIYKTGYDDDGWGNFIVIAQTDGIFAIYCHLSKRVYKAGTSIRAGELIGIEGETGMARGSHLHLEFRTDYTDKYATIDPCKYLNLEKKVDVTIMATISTDAQAALKKLVRVGIISNTTYWVNIIPTVKNLDSLLIKIAAKL